MIRSRVCDRFNIERAHGDRVGVTVDRAVVDDELDRVGPRLVDGEARIDGRGVGERGGTCGGLRGQLSAVGQGVAVGAYRITGLEAVVGRYSRFGGSRHRLVVDGTTAQNFPFARCAEGNARRRSEIDRGAAVR